MNVTPVSFAEASKVRANLGSVAWVFQSSGGVALPTLLHPTIAVPQQHIRISHPVHLACPLSLINPRRGDTSVERNRQAGYLYFRIFHASVLTTSDKSQRVFRFVSNSGNTRCILNGGNRCRGRNAAISRRLSLSCLRSNRWGRLHRLMLTSPMSPLYPARAWISRKVSRLLGSSGARPATQCAPSVKVQCTPAVRR